MTDSTQQHADGSVSSPEPASPCCLPGRGESGRRRKQLAAVNTAGLAALRSYLDAGEAVAFLGAGTSAPLYPLWTGVIAELINTAVEQGLGEDAAATCRALAGKRPDAVVELLRRHLGPAATGRRCGRCSGSAATRSRDGPGPRPRSWCAAARSRRW